MIFIDWYACPIDYDTYRGRVITGGDQATGTGTGPNDNQYQPEDCKNMCDDPTLNAAVTECYAYAYNDKTLQWVSETQCQVLGSFA